MTPLRPPTLVRRRAVLATLGSACTSVFALPPPPAPSHDPFGPVTPPLPASPWRLVDEREKALDLRRRLRGKVTALQLMFTGCSATCPIQGALFAAVAPRLDSPDAQLLSISIDPLSDDPKALRSWLDRFGRHPAWHAARPEMRDVDPLLDFLRGRATGVDRHTAQVFLFDREARLLYRTPDMPSPAQVTSMLSQLAALG